MYLYISKIPGGYRIRATGHAATKFYYYSKREAIKKYRAENGLRYKHLITIE